MNFTTYLGKQWIEILAGAKPEAVGLVEALVRYESGSRLDAREVRRIVRSMWDSTDLE